QPIQAADHPQAADHFSALAYGSLPPSRGKVRKGGKVCEVCAQPPFLSFPRKGGRNPRSSFAEGTLEVLRRRDPRSNFTEKTLGVASREERCSRDSPRALHPRLRATGCDGRAEARPSCADRVAIHPPISRDLN